MRTSQRVAYIAKYLDDKADERLIDLIYGLIEADRVEGKDKFDWWDEISEEEREGIKKGLAQADKGEVTPHKQVMSKYKKWL